MEHWSREESTKRWEENEARLKAMSIEELEADLATTEAKEATITEGIIPDRKDRDYAKMPRKLAHEQATLVMEKIGTMMIRMDLNRHIRDKREGMPLRAS
jgi:hypothetical protein